MIMAGKTFTMPSPDQALPGRDERMPVAEKHHVLGTAMQPPFPDRMQQALFGLGCFWGAEKIFWQQAGVYSTMVGYSAGHTPNPTYREVCSGMTGHNEVVRVIFDAQKIGYRDLLKLFWLGHNPTQGMRQGNDRGTQYRSGIYTLNSEQQQQAEASKETYQAALDAAGYPAITTEIIPATEFYYAEDGHQQYLARNPGGYCGLGGTGIAWPEE